MRDRGRGVACVHGHAQNVPSYKEGNHLHRPYHFPQIPSLLHCLPLHVVVVSLFSTASTALSHSPPPHPLPHLHCLHLSDGRRSWRHRRNGLRCGGAAGSGCGDRGYRQRPRRCGETHNCHGCGGLCLIAAEGDGVEQRSPSRCSRCAACREGAGICTCLACRVSCSLVALVRL